jgi:uncharacterized protein YchJ
MVFELYAKNRIMKGYIMKKTIIICTMVAFLVGCQSTISTQQVSQQTNERSSNTPEHVLKASYDALIKKDYDKFVAYLSPDFSNPAEYSKKLKEADFNNSTERSDYLIGDINSYDDTHKWASISVKGNSKGTTSTSIENVMLVLKDNKWLLDYSLVISKKTLNVPPFTTEDKFLTFSNFTMVQMVNGIRIDLQLKNNSNSIPLFGGWSGMKSNSKLQTEQGTYNFQMDNGKLLPNNTVDLNLIFEGAKGDPQSLIMSGLLMGDSSGGSLPDPSKKPLSYKINFQ